VTTSTTSSTPTSGVPVTKPIPATGPGIRIQAVPALRDIQVMIDGTSFTTNADGVIDAPEIRGSVSVRYLGYSASPPLQQVGFRTWSDGSTAPSRRLDADGQGHVSLGVDLRYRVTVRVSGANGSPSTKLTASSAVETLTFTDGSTRWVLSQRGELSEDRLTVKRVVYSFDPPRGGSAQKQRFTAGPEDLWLVKAT